MSVIEAGRMFRDGRHFYRSENGVWLTDSVPPGYLRIAVDSQPTWKLENHRHREQYRRCDPS